MREYKRYDEYKDSGVEWIGKIPKDWKSFKARRLGFFSTSGVNKKINEDEKKVNLINYTDVYGNKSKEIKYKDDYMLVSANKNQLVKNKLKVGDVLFTPSSETADDIGHSAIIKEKLPNTLYSYHLVRMEFEKKVDLNYKKYLFNNYYVLRYFEMKASGTTRMTLGLDDFKNVVVFLPPKSEQQKIASFLDQKTAKIDEIINKKETLIDHLEKYKKSVITEAVTKGKLRNKYIDEDGELVDQIEIKDSGIKIIGKISNFFDISKIKLKMKNITDGAHVSPDTENGVYDFISVTDLDKNKIDFENCLKTSKKSYRNLVRNGCKPVKNDVLLSKDGTIGETVIIEENHDFVIASSLIILRPKKEINSKFLNYFLKSNSYQNQLNMYSKGAALKRVSITNVSRTYIVFMDLEIQELIVKFLDEITTQIDILIQKTKESIEKYKEYKKSLIFEAVTGKIDLRDCELEGGEEFVEHNNSRETKRERLSAVD